MFCIDMPIDDCYNIVGGNRFGQLAEVLTLPHQELALPSLPYIHEEEVHMSPLKRRRLFQVAGISLGSTVLGQNYVSAHTGLTATPGTRAYQGVNLSAWEVVVGDATSPCKPQVGINNIETIHFTDYSEVRANTRAQKDMMAHNITFKRFFDDHVLDFVHVCEYKFRLPYQPATGNTDFNGQTVEGHIGLWDGQTSKRLRSVAYQWIVNPHWIIGTIQCWTPRGWQPVGTVPIDTQWHTIRMVIDPLRETTSLQIDTNYFPSCFVEEPKLNFGSDVSAVFAAEAVSIDPGAQCNGGMPHKVQFKDWTWTWEAANTCKVFSPLVTRDT
jgi:hypothetical protein